MVSNTTQSRFIITKENKDIVAFKFPLSVPYNLANEKAHEINPLKYLYM